MHNDIYLRDILKDRSFETSGDREIIALCSRNYQEMVLEQGLTASMIDPNTHETLRGSTVRYYAYCDELDGCTWCFDNTTLKLTQTQSTLTEAQQRIIRLWVNSHLKNQIDDMLHGEFLVDDALVDADDWVEINARRQAAVELIRSLL